MQEWLKQPGIIKKLQTFLAVSICLNIFFIFDKIPKRTAKAQAPTVVQAEERLDGITDTELSRFVHEYLKYFFNTGIIAEKYIAEKTSPELFEAQIKEQLAIREENKLESNFNILDSYSETLTREAKTEELKIIIAGTENFSNKDYQARTITMSFIIKADLESRDLLVTAIPEFKVET